MLGFRDFTGGLVTMAPGESANGLLAVKDLYADPSGRGLRLMDGGTDTNTSWSGATSGTTAEFIEIFDWQTVDAVALIRGQAKVWSYTPNSSSANITGAYALSNPNPAAHMVAGVTDGAAVQSVGIFSNEGWTWGGGGNIAAWTATLGSLPSGNRPMTWTNNRMYGVSSTANLSTLVWSDILDANSWPTDNFVQVGNSSDGEAISAIVAFGPYILLFRYNSIYVIYDLDTGANRLLTDDVGTLSWRTCAASPYGVFFLGGDGIMYLTNGSSVSPISRSIADAVDDPTGLINVAVGRGPVGFYHDDWYELSLWNGTNYNRHLRYHIPTKSWWEQSLHPTNGVAPRSWTVRKARSGLYYALYPDNGSGKPATVRQVFQKDSVSGLSPMVQLPYLNFGGPLPRTRLRSVNVRTAFDGAHTMTLYDSDGSTLWSRSVTPSDNQARVFGTGASGLTRGGSLQIDFPTPNGTTSPTNNVLDSVEFEYSQRAD